MDAHPTHHMYRTPWRHGHIVHCLKCNGNAQDGWYISQPCPKADREGYPIP